MPNNDSGRNMVGWVYFAGIIMILRGVSDAFLGITSLINKQYLFIKGADSHNLIVSTTYVNAWGWVQLAVGLLVVAAGFSLLHGSNWARIFAIVFIGASFVVNMAFLGVFPLWSIIAMIVDVVVIYALVIQGKEKA